MTTPSLQLGFNLQFADLYSTNGLQKLDEIFCAHLSVEAPELAEQLAAARANPPDSLQTSRLMLALGAPFEAFVCELFGIDAAHTNLVVQHESWNPILVAKRKFVQRIALRSVPAEEAIKFDEVSTTEALDSVLGKGWTEAQFAQRAIVWLALAPESAEYQAQSSAIEAAKHYAAWAVHSKIGRARHSDGVLFKTASGIDPNHLVHGLQSQRHPDGYTVHQINIDRLRRREGFKLTDNGADLGLAIDQSNYCIWCHEQGRDSCRHGLKTKQLEPTQGIAAFKQSAHGVTLAGCPLEERISEFQKLKAQALPIAALGVICVDNPMAAATGHRICNDCMKSCIYQKQDAVNIPQVETRTLKDVLELPWGFEIYSLLTRWNPFHLARPVPKTASGRKVLVVGMGPAGFTLAHHLLNEGHAVVGIDGLKVEPLPEGLQHLSPIHDVKSLQTDLDQRSLAGFGGVAEYGITVRWDKNFLGMIRLLLVRREQFAMFGGVRFGSTITTEQAFAMGFDHISLAIGAGKPTTLDIPNGLARGVRVASDFLMSLQLTGAAQAQSLSNLQMRLPVLVVGGGLTAIDTATESLAYYPVQVEKFLQRHEILLNAQIDWRKDLSEEDALIAQEFVEHALAIRAEKGLAATEGRSPRIVELLQSWGGATIAYRKKLIQAPSYTLNHEEVEKALEEGIAFAEELTPLSVEIDGFGAASGLEVRCGTSDETVVMPARTIFIAAGTSANTVLSNEEPWVYQKQGKYFKTLNEQGEIVVAEHAISKPQETLVLTHQERDGRSISFFGDVHPSYFGNVVKAMASAKKGFPIVHRALMKLAAVDARPANEFFSYLNQQLNATVHAVRRLTPNIVEVVIKAPLAARNFKPGQFYRLQNFGVSAHLMHQGIGIKAMEGLALTGAWKDDLQGLLGTIVLEMGGSSDWCIDLEPGEPVILMGPTGEPTEIVSQETVLLVGGGLGNAVLFSIGAAMRAAGCRVLYFAGYKKQIDRYKVAEIEAAADVVVWCCDEQPGFAPSRSQDRSFVGNIVQAIVHYAQDPTAPIKLEGIDRIVAIGSDRMMSAVAKARHNELGPWLNATHKAIGSINSPMQCMMKEICGQCLQTQVDPLTGKKSVVFSCANQDQELDRVDWQNLNDRLAQNRCSEALTRALVRFDRLAPKAI